MSSWTGTRGRRAGGRAAGATALGQVDGWIPRDTRGVLLNRGLVSATRPMLFPSAGSSVGTDSCASRVRAPEGESLLGSVVWGSIDPPPGCVRGRYDPCARLGRLRRTSALAMAVAMSSVKSTVRCSMSRKRSAPRRDVDRPPERPSTAMGASTA